MPIIGGTNPSDLAIAAGLGLRAGTSTELKFGRNPDIDTASLFEAIWNGGGRYTGQDLTLGTATTLSITSSSVNDDAGGTGALTMDLFGLDEDGVEQTETVILNGTVGVSSALQYWRMNRMIVRTSGSLGWNDGEITAVHLTDALQIFAVMPANYNQTMIAAYTIPLAKTGWLFSWFAGLAGKTQANCNVRLRMRPSGEVFQVKEEFSITGAGSSYVQREFSLPKGPFSALTDIFVEADTDSNNTGVAAGFDILMLDD